MLLQAVSSMVLCVKQCAAHQGPVVMPHGVQRWRMQGFLPELVQDVGLQDTATQSALDSIKESGSPHRTGWQEHSRLGAHRAHEHSAVYGLECGAVDGAEHALHAPPELWRQAVPLLVQEARLGVRKLLRASSRVIMRTWSASQPPPQISVQ